MNRIPKVYQVDGLWYWDILNESDGPFSTEEEALNHYIDNHICEEE